MPNTVLGNENRTVTAYILENLTAYLPGKTVNNTWIYSMLGSWEALGRNLKHDKEYCRHGGVPPTSRKDWCLAVENVGSRQPHLLAPPGSV